MSSKILIILFYFSSLTFALCQEETVPKIKGENIKLAKKEKTNAPLLVSKLMKGKETDKEKFDAIFYWVANNIEYSENYFYTEYEYGPEVIEDILENRKTICLGYSQLMDSLCKLADIKNVTVFGFAKDWFNDVGDSIYVHNHAWNAVKLDDLWYLYDVTWSYGVKEFVYTGKARLILSLLNKFPEKYKRKTFKVPRKLRKRALCEKIEPVVYYKKKFFNTLIRKWLQSFPIIPRRHLKKGITKDFYLSEPDIFAATHVPDDPIWSLTNRKKVSDFENDSLSYYLNDSILKHQKIQGTICAECDEYIESSWQVRLNLMNQHSDAFNYKNKFINTYCYSELGKHHFYKSLYTDAPFKLVVADTSVNDFSNELISAKESRNNLVRFYKFHKSKNDKKAKLLLKENVGHLKFVKGKVKLTLYEKRRVKEVVNKSYAFARVYIRNRKKFKSYRTKYNFEKYKPYADNRIKELNRVYSKKTAQYDSLNILIEKHKTQFDSIAVHLSLNIWPIVLQHDSIYNPFLECIKLRGNLLDNYKKNHCGYTKKNTLN